MAEIGQNQIQLAKKGEPREIMEGGKPKQIKGISPQSAASQGSLPKSQSPAGQMKLRVGFFSFTGCEGCMIEFLEILNTKYFQWAPLLDVRYARLLKERTNVIDEMDVAFIEGAISSYPEEERMKLIRSKAKYIVAIGSCAISGAPNNWRNSFDEQTLREIEPVLKRFKHRPKVTPISDVVKVDANVPGCPMLDSRFIEVMEKYMKEFGVLQ